MKKERGHVKDVALRIGLLDDRPKDRHRSSLELALAVVVEERRNQRVAAPVSVQIVVVSMKENGGESKVHIAASACSEIGPHEREGPVGAPVRGRQKGRRMEVTAVLGFSFEKERGEPVVVLARRFPVDDRPHDHKMAVSVPNAPERRKDGVDVQLERAAPVVEESVEPLRVLVLGHAVERLRRVA